MAVDSIQVVMDNLAKKLTDKEWVDKQEPEFINNLHQLGNVVQNLSTQIYLFIDLYQQYVMAMQQSPIFAAPAAATDDERSNVSPTQTSAAPANREQRRAQAKQNKKLLVPDKKLIVP